jgi:hypothetical protein
MTIPVKANNNTGDIIETVKKDVAVGSDIPDLRSARLLR